VRMWALGTAFIAGSAAVYFLFMAAWLNFLLFIGAVVWVRAAVALVALGGGFYYLREYFRNPDAACKVTAPEARRPIANRLHRRAAVVRDGAKIAFYEHGGGAQTILMMNPIVYGLAIFQPVIEQLAQEFRIITLDPRGTGASDPLPARYSLADHMEDVRAVIEETGAAPVIGVGISRGGNLLVKLAVAHPALLAGLVLVGTPRSYSPGLKGRFHEPFARGDVEGPMRLFWPTVHSEPGTEDLVEQAVQHCLRLPVATVLNFFDDDPERDIVPILERVRVPTLVIHGTDDRRVPFSNATELYRGLKEMGVPVELFVYPGLGHTITKPRENHAVLHQNLSWFSHYLLGEKLELL